MELFFLWLIGSVLVAVFASSRARSGFGWLLLSLFISPLIALIFLAILPNRGGSVSIAEVPQSLEGRLKEIERLKENGLVSEDEYAAKRKAILESN